MLLYMHIENVAVIDKAQIEFNKGFHILTGETGAGKSILIGSINMLLGERTSKDLIRYGENKALVQGLFLVHDERVLNLLNSLDITPEEDNTILVSRELSVDGKNVCKINQKLVPVSVLKEVGRHLVNIHGQHDNQALLDNSTHIDFLDRFADKKIRQQLDEYRVLYKHCNELQKEIETLNIDEADKIRRLDLLTYEIEELRVAKLQTDEEEELKRKRDIINHAKRLMDLVGQSYELLNGDGDEGCAYNFVAMAVDNIIQASNIDDSLEPLANSLNDAMLAIEECASEIRHYFDRIQIHNDGIDEIEARLDTIYHLKRKYGGSVESCLAYLKKIEEEFENITMSDERKETLKKELEKAKKEMKNCAEKLRKTRTQTAIDIETKIKDSLAFLDMERVDFKVQIDTCSYNINGFDKVEFLIATNVGEPLKPLSKIVSGGELSRIMLAMKSILAQSDVVDTLIFDEIDTGVSGRAAQKIGSKMGELAKLKQVLCITHLAQIAATADRHFRIDKAVVGDKTVTNVTLLDKKERVMELARIIGGDNITQTTLKQAEEMLVRRG